MEDRRWKMKTTCQRHLPSSIFHLPSSVFYLLLNPHDRNPNGARRIAAVDRPKLDQLLCALQSREIEDGKCPALERRQVDAEVPEREGVRVERTARRIELRGVVRIRAGAEVRAHPQPDVVQIPREELQVRVRGREAGEVVREPAPAVPL